MEVFFTFLEDRRARPFQWGINDCCIFSADCVSVLTGVDLAADLRGTYATEPEAAAVLARLGGVERLASDRLEAAGFKEVSVTFAQRGDVVLAGLQNEAALGICAGTHAVFVNVAIGLGERPMKHCRRAWRIG